MIRTIFPPHRAPTPDVGRSVSTANPGKLRAGASGSTDGAWGISVRDISVRSPAGCMVCGMPNTNRYRPITEGLLDYVARTRPA